MRKPKQVQLTKEESEFFEEQSKLCKCEVYREFDPRDENERPLQNQLQTYHIILHGISQTSFQEVDSLQKKSFELAHRLNNDILNSDLNYKFDEIVVEYCYSKSKNEEKSRYFKFATKNLNDK